MTHEAREKKKRKKAQVYVYVRMLSAAMESMLHLPKLEIVVKECFIRNKFPPLEFNHQNEAIPRDN